MTEMKNSGINWLGDIPSTWKVEKVKHGFFRKKAEAHQVNPIVLSLARSGVKERDLSNNEGQIAESYYNYNPVDIDDLLINPMDLYSGANCSISKTKGVISPAYVNLRFREGYNPEYYDYYFKIQYWLMAFFAFGKGVSFDNRWTLNTDTLMNYPIIVPSYESQCSIVSFLNSECTRIDQAIANQEAIIDKLKEYKLSFITEAVTKGLDPSVEFKDSGVEWLGQIPSNWSIFRVANLYFQTNEKGNDDLPILTVSINSGISDRELDDDEQDRVFARSEDRTKYKQVIPGDLAYNMMRAWQGAFGAVRVNGMVSPAYITCRPQQGVSLDTRYIEYLLRSSMAIEEMHRYSHGIADFRLRLYWPEFKNIKLCLPPVDEQSRIADYIDKTSTAIEAEIIRIQKVIERLIEYKKSLIYEVVTGKKEVCSL